MTHRISRNLSITRKLLLAAAGIAAVAGPVLIGVLHAQSQLSLEVASVKPSDPDARGIIMTFTLGGGVRVVNGTLKQMVMLAYDVEKFQISGGPGWLDSQRFDLLAKAPGEANGDTRELPADQRSQAARQRPQTLLAERFQLSMRRDAKEASVYALVVAKNGPKLNESNQGFDGIIGRPGQLIAERVPVQALAAYLAGLGRPVLDKTGLKATYAFKLEWTPDAGGSGVGKSEIASEKAVSAGVSAPDPTGPAIFNALQEQLGLKLKSQKAPVEHLLIERAEKPSAN